jgi:hypothetical protein
LKPSSVEGQSVSSIRETEVIVDETDGRTLPDPIKALIPTVNIAPAKGWPEGARPTAPSGLEVKAFATGLDHPRWLYVLPNGDVLVAESNAPTDRPEEGKGIKGMIYREVQYRAGAGMPSADRITLVGSTDRGGAASKSVFLKHLHSPIGMALVGRDLYVANTDAIMRFSLFRRRRRNHRSWRQGRGSAGWSDQSSLGEERDREPRRLAPLCHGRLQQQCGRERSRQRGEPRRHTGGRAVIRQDEVVCLGLAQPERPRL